MVALVTVSVSGSAGNFRPPHKGGKKPSDVGRDCIRWGRWSVDVSGHTNVDDLNESRTRSLDRVCRVRGSCNRLLSHRGATVAATASGIKRFSTVFNAASDKPDMV